MLNFWFAVGGLAIGLAMVVTVLVNRSTVGSNQARGMPMQKFAVLVGGALLVISIVVRVGFILFDRPQQPPQETATVGQVATPSAKAPQRARQAGIPLAGLSQSEWPKLVIPAGGRSELVRRPSGMHIVMAGNQFLLYTVYPDGSECAFGQPCAEGSLGSYARNEASETNIISYAFAPD